MARCIFYTDLDAVFASVEQVPNGKLKRKPVIGGGNPEGRGTAVYASYETPGLWAGSI